MRTNWIASLILTLGLCACGGTSEAPKDEKPEKEKSTSSGNPLTAPVDYIGAVGKAKKVSEKRVNLANIQNAIKQFQAVEGRYPKTLKELVTEGYFPRAPRPPRGMRYVYDPKTGQVGVR
ncbi:MAG: hypothetical protein H8E20_10840 [Verrucomicrobia bacterium]|nr:hypothetical protein [Verrucomicrobiota bacterium]